MSSLLFSYEARRSALADGAAKAIHFQMAAFNGDSPKPLILKGSPPYLKTFAEVAKARLKHAKKPTHRLVRKGGKSFTGKAKPIERLHKGDGNSDGAGIHEEKQG